MSRLVLVAVPCLATRMSMKQKSDQILQPLSPLGVRFPPFLLLSAVKLCTVQPLTLLST